MKCQKCENAATFHITEIQDGTPMELHLCEQHAREYLAPSSEGEDHAPSSMAAVLAQQMAIGQTAEDLARLDQRECPICGISFYEFRSKGRLGCPNDYLFFEKELNPLILNIHGESEHRGKQPVRCADGTEERSQLIRLRREMKDAVAEEKYERASELRDEISRISGGSMPPKKAPEDDASSGE
ncbi:MAG: UvrB/UvrC motif-containing protein [Planctomycetes bacterium]|nr:UvrB/UvrC motif-containing protein [Planctomycetota bacterium]